MLFSRNSSLLPTDVFLHTTGVNHQHHLQRHDPMHCSCHINYNSQLASKSRSHTHWLHRKVERNPATRWGDKTSHSPHQDLWFPAPPVIMPAINRFYRQSKLEDGLLVIKSDNPKFMWETNKIVVPTSILPMVLSSIHNRANHPIRHQLSQIMKRYFFTSGLKNQIDKLFKQCTICVATRKFKKQTARSTEPQPPKAPGTQVNTDIIKCAVQLIIVTLDLFTNYVTTTIILAEKKEAIIEAIIVLWGCGGSVVERQAA